MKYGDIGCFYLSENLDEAMDYKQPAAEANSRDHLYKLPEPLPDALHHYSGKKWSCINIYLMAFSCCCYCQWWWA